MKIIGTDGRDACIVHMTKDELAQLAGFSSSYQVERENQISLKAGQEVDVAKLYNDATGLVNLYSDFKKDLAQNQARLNKLAEILNPKPVLGDSKKT